MNPTPQGLPTILWMLAALAGAFVCSVAIGATNLEWGTLWQEFIRAESSSLAGLVLWELRLPRAILGAAVGAALGMAGAAMQGLLRNPLAEPGLVGVSGSAALGAALVFYSGLSTAVPLSLPLGGMSGAIVGVSLLYLLAGRRVATLTIILAGVAVNAFAGALTALVLNLSPNPFAALEIIFWQLGSLANRSMEHVVLTLPLIIVGCGLLMSARKGLDALTLGEDVASSLGVSMAKTRLCVIGGTGLAVGSAVAVSGVIGFVGLVVPHLLRPLVGHQPGRLLFLSGIGGAVLVLAADVMVRLIPTGNELKLGVLTALIGAPFFLGLIQRMRRQTL